ncbi:MAG: helix-turn-helix transcriptional regulator [Polyangiaceae bacterium]|nr:helix-turn-helix transcriptional regulator [Polyangiaceae bacterium]
MKVRPVVFGKEIRRIRLASGLTLEQLSERAGLTPNYIGSVENGRRDPSLSTVLALAAGLEREPGELFGSALPGGPTAVEAAHLLESLPLEVQVAVVELLRELVKKRR